MDQIREIEYPEIDQVSGEFLKFIFGFAIAVISFYLGHGMLCLQREK